MEKCKQFFMIIALACVVTGCGKVKASPSDMDTLSVMKDGKIKQVIVDHFEQNYYNVDELAEMTNKKIGLYSDTSEDIVCESVEEEDGMITVKIAYQTAGDYTDFNGRDLFIGTVADAAGKGYSLGDMISGDNGALSDTELEKIENNHVVIIQIGEGEEMGVNVYDKILYTSSDVVLSGKKNAIITTGDTTRLSCIVFK